MSNGFGLRHQPLADSLSPIALAHGVSSVDVGDVSTNSEDFEHPKLDITDHTKLDLDGRLRESAVSAACLACRNKHLKCDGQTPCSRCIACSSECVYIASRRGYRGPRRGTTQNPNKRHATSPPDVGNECPMLLGAGTSNLLTPIGSVPSTPMTMPGGSSASSSILSTHSPASFQGTPPGPTPSQLYRSFRSINGVETAVAISNSTGPQVPYVSQVSLPERCLNSFYDNFYAAHPFVLPKEHLLRIAKTGTIEPLLTAIRWVGSIFIEVGSTRQALYEDVRRLMQDPRQARDGFMVQALMLLIVALDGSCQNDKAVEYLGQAETLALQIGLDTKHFAPINGRGDPVMEESWRRTWWDLFIIDGMIAGVHRTTNFMLFDILAGAGLPCEEDEYLSGNIPEPSYLDDLENRQFLDENRQFSSFAYRILCGRNLGKFMRTPTIWGPDDENLARIEALLTNWRLHLPASKRDSLQKDGKLDEMMFQAHMMMYATSILLHQPHSQLDSSPAKDVTSCAPYQRVQAGELFNAHTKHTLSSAAGISKMITHRVPLLSHTHFFTCVITLSSIVHLNTWALFFVPHDDDELRQQISLNIGALNTLSRVWGAAARARGQVQGVAQEIYQVKKQQQRDPQYWVGYTQEEVMNSIAADESIISNFDIMTTPHSQLPG